jgi:hypothetical protein
MLINVIFSADVHISYLSRSQSIDRDICDHLLYILTIYLNFILILSINQKAIFMGSLMQWLYLERMKVHYPIKILDTAFSTHLHINGPVINVSVNLTFTETFVNTTLKFSRHTC